ncbi:MAG: hypothetical protein Kow0067_00700 [Coriobacteriia bacterium]
MIAIVIAACLGASGSVPALAAPSAAQTAEDRAAVEAAMDRYDAAKESLAAVEARMAEAGSRLDDAIAREAQAHERLRMRVVAMYRADESGFLSMLLGSATIQDFMTRWDLLTRIARQDAVTLEELKAARVEAETTAGQLLELQTQAAATLDAVAKEVERAKKELAASEAALRAYESRVAAAARRPASDSTQQLTGSGQWQTAVASHYGLDFTGTGASGESIGPYSMIVAHKTLPFGTLIEFEYNGKRAVAKVVDRGPYTEGRTFDLGPGVIRVLGFRGVHEVRYRIISR